MIFLFPGWDMLVPRRVLQSKEHLVKLKENISYIIWQEFMSRPFQITRKLRANTHSEQIVQNLGVSIFFVMFTSNLEKSSNYIRLFFWDGLKPPTIEMDDSYLNLPSYNGVRSLKLTAIAPQNWCLGECCPFGALGLFSGVLAVGFRGEVSLSW